LTPNKKQEEWRLIFIILTVVYIIGTAVFNLFATSETQLWAKNEINEAHELGQ
jgi:hypothetical protein